MLNKISCLLLSALFLAACGNDQPATEAATSTPSGQLATSKSTSTNSLEELKANALQEDDVYGRISHSLGTLQQEYAATVNQAPNVGETSVFLDEKLNVVIKNERGGDVYETVFNLKDLNPENGGLSLIPDKQPGEFPGLRIQAIEGRPGVKKLKNSKLVSEERVVEIYMPQRGNIEKIVPAIVAALNVAHGKN
jgi:hypothetical protein